MTKHNLNLRFSVITSLILLCAFSRVIPHMPNFSPLGAMSLFGAAHFSKKWLSFTIPIFATWLSDLFINNVIYAAYYPEFTWLYEGFYWQYGSYLIITLVGIFIFRKINTQRIITGALSATIIFFLISNFGCWLGSQTYPQSPSGLLTCYAAGLPFLKGTLLGDLFYTMLLFGSFAWLQGRLPQLRSSIVYAEDNKLK